MKDYSSYSDSELTGLFRSGDDAAFTEIYQRYDTLLYLFAYNKLRNKEEAVDVVQDVFVWILNNREDFSLKTSLSSYLYKSVLNKIFGIFRHQAIIRKYIEQGEHFIDVDSTETDFLIREKDIRELIEQEIAVMPPRMREIYLLKYKRHLSPKQIAAELDIAESTVHTQLSRATGHLKEKLGVVIYVLFILNS